LVLFGPAAPRPGAGPALPPAQTKAAPPQTPRARRRPDPYLSPWAAEALGSRGMEVQGPVRMQWDGEQRELVIVHWPVFLAANGSGSVKPG
jgi:hypothetical protein